MQHNITYQKVLGIYTNSDAAGGATNSRGNVYLLGYKLNKNAVVNYSIYDFEKNVETSPSDLKVSQLDLTISF